MKFKNLLLLFILFIIPSVVQASTVDELYKKTILLNEEIDKNPFLSEYIFKHKLSSVDKKEIDLYLSNAQNKETENFYKLLTFSILLQSSGNEDLRNYYNNKNFELYQTNHSYMLLFYVAAIKFDWPIIEKIESSLQYYRLLNNYYTYKNFSDIVLSSVNMSFFSTEKEEDVFLKLEEVNNSNLSSSLYEIVTNIFNFNIPNLTQNLKKISNVFANDFQNFNIILINTIKFSASILTNIFLLLSAFIFIKRRKVIYHNFLHKLPAKAPIIYHRIFSILGTYIFYEILGLYGLFILFGFLSIKHLTRKDRNLILITSVLILVNIMANQFVSFLYLSLPNNSSYSLYNSVYLEGYKQDSYEKILNYEKQDDPMLIAARAIIEYKKGDFVTSIEYWNKFDDISASVLTNKANAYYMLGDYETAETIYKEALDFEPLAETYYNLSKLYLVHLQMDKHDKYINKAMKMNSVFVDKYIALNNKYLPDEKASQSMISPLPVKTIMSYIIADAFNTEYFISSFFQFFVLLKLLVVIGFILFILNSKMRNPRVCSICGMMICYNCVGTENICNICNTNLENVKSKILRNKIMLELGYNNKIFEFKLYKFVTIIVPGSYNIMFKKMNALSILKIIVLVSLWTLLFFTFDTQSLNLINIEILDRINGVTLILILATYAYNIFSSLRNYRVEKKSIIRPGGI